MGGEPSIFKQIRNQKPHAYSGVLFIISSILFIPIIVSVLVVSGDRSGWDNLAWLFVFVICSGLLMLLSLIGMIIVFITWLKKKNRKVSEYLFLAHLILFLSPWGLGYGFFHFQEQKRITEADAYYQALNLDQKLAYKLKGWRLTRSAEDVETISSLIKQGADINALNANNFTPLCDSVIQENRSELIQFILDKGADINHRCWNGRTAAHVTASMCRDKNMETLAANNADLSLMTDDQKTPFDILLDDFDRNQHGCSKTALVMAKHGVDINQTDKEGNTLLHKMIPRATLYSLKRLMETGIDAGIKNGDGLTALDLARQIFEKNNHPQYQEVIDYLAEQEK